MQLCSFFFNLALFKLCYSSLSDGMLYESTIHVFSSDQPKSSIL